MPRWFWGWLRGWALFLAALAAFVHFIGMPHLLVTYEYFPRRGGPVYHSCRYLGPFGFKQARPGEDVGENCPVIAFINWEQLRQ